MCTEGFKPQPVLPVSLNGRPRFTRIRPPLTIPRAQQGSGDLTPRHPGILVNCRETDQKVVHELYNNVARHEHTGKRAKACVWVWRPRAHTSSAQTRQTAGSYCPAYSSYWSNGIHELASKCLFFNTGMWLLYIFDCICIFTLKGCVLLNFSSGAFWLNDCCKDGEIRLALSCFLSL